MNLYASTKRAILETKEARRRERQHLATPKRYHRENRGSFFKSICALFGKFRTH